MQCAIVKIEIYQTARSYKVNQIVNKYLLAGDKFMPEMHLR